MQGNSFQCFLGYNKKHKTGELCNCLVLDIFNVRRNFEETNSFVLATSSLKLCGKKSLVVLAVKKRNPLISILVKRQILQNNHSVTGNYKFFYDFFYKHV